MEVSDWITIISAFIIAIGWFVTGYLNRVKDIAQKRLEYRMEMLEAFLPVWFAIVKDKAALKQPIIVEQLDEARKKFHLYGRNDENELMDKLIGAIGNNNSQEAAAIFDKLIALVRSRIREELKIDS